MNMILTQYTVRTIWLLLLLFLLLVFCRFSCFSLLSVGLTADMLSVFVGGGCDWYGCYKLVVLLGVIVNRDCCGMRLLSIAIRVTACLQFKVNVVVVVYNALFWFTVCVVLVYNLFSFCMTSVLLFRVSRFVHNNNKYLFLPKIRF